MTITKRNYVLIDFENTQAIEAERLRGLPVKIVIFVGQHQKSLPLELVRRLLEYQGTVELYESAGVGKNALDFQLAFYAGRVFEREPEAYVHIVSRDKGFDPLVTHIRNQGRPCYRVDSFAELPILRGLDDTPAAEKEDFTKYPLTQRVDFALARLKKMQSNCRPRKIKTLKSAIHSQFMKQLPEEEIQVVVNELVKSRQVIVGAADSITYNL